MARILIVEDDAPNIEILQRLMARAKHDTVVAGNKQDAIATATAETIDLILMDIGIPDAEGEAVNKDGGLEATRQLKSKAQTQSIPIIVTSASAMLDEKKRFLEAGCDDVQSKPYEFAALLASIKKQLDARG